MTVDSRCQIGYNILTAKIDRTKFVGTNFYFKPFSYIVNQRPRAVVTGSILAERSPKTTAGAVPFTAKNETSQTLTTPDSFSFDASAIGGRGQ